MLLRRRILLLTFKLYDIMVMLFAFIMARNDGHLPSPLLPPEVDSFLILESGLAGLLFLLGFALAWHSIFFLMNLYHSRRLSSRWPEVYDIVKATTAGTLILLLVLFGLEKDVLTTRFIIIFWISATGITVGSRQIMRYMLAFVRLLGHNLRYILIVGTNNRALEFADHLESDKKLGYSVIGFVDDEWIGTWSIRKSRPVIVANLTGFREFLRHKVVDEVMMCLPMKSFYDQALQIVTICEEQGLKVHFLPTLFDLKFAKSKIERFGKEMMITIATGAIPKGWPLIVKRTLDIVVSSLCILVLLPSFAIAGLLIKTTSPGPVFFVQDRVGLNKRRFRLYKFRTMVQDAEQKIRELEELNEVSGPVFKIKNDPRITPFGKFLRKTSIDELPQLFNVLKGDMSLVGPRPLPVRDYEGFCQDWHRRRFSVRPGITCLWQISGRSTVQFDHWMELDMKYIDQWSLKLDLMILLRTIPAVFRATGAT